MERSSAQWDLGPAAAARPPTPRLVLDEAILESNLSLVAGRVHELGARFRPHIKTHKSTEILRRQIAAGIDGVTVATIREAELAVAAGVDDILVAYPPVGPWKLAAIDSLLDRCRVIVACAEAGHVAALAELGRPVEIYWELDTGTGRLGTAPGETTANAIEAALLYDDVRLAGLMAFGGHAYSASSAEALRAIAAAEGAALASTSLALAERGIEAGVLSSGTTPLLEFPVASATEYRFGCYAFCDATQVRLGVVGIERCALTVRATVVGRPAPDRVILDAGSKALAAERMSAATGSFGLVLDHPELDVERLYEEHAICRVDGTSALRLGDVVELVPNHACTCSNLHDAYSVRLRDGREESWPIQARGWTHLEGNEAL